MSDKRKDDFFDEWADYILGLAPKPSLIDENGFLFRPVYTSSEIEIGRYFCKKHDRILHEIVMSGGYLHG